MRTNVYVDGFNLYYGLFNNKVRRLPWKWLNLVGLARRLLPRSCKLDRLRYFTADVVHRPNDLDQRIRQQTYLRALSTLHQVTVHKGNFLSGTKPARPVQPIPLPSKVSSLKDECVNDVKRVLRGLQRLEIHYTEEKGSDVNLASYLLHDVALDDCDTVMVVSNDSDLATPLELAKSVWDVRILLVNPHPRRPTALLRKIADEIRPIRSNVVRECQFPEQMQDANGMFHKPAKWARDEFQSPQ